MHASPIDDLPQGEIVPVASIARSCHLVPLMGQAVPSHWRSDTVLDECNAFVINPYIDHHTFYHLQVAAASSI
jgi:hypothetical protein